MRPVVATIIGDPSGIGPEIVVRSWANGRVHSTSKPVLIGCLASVQRAVEQTSLSVEIRKIESLEDLADSPGVIDVLDSGFLDYDDVVPGQTNLACGKAVGLWLKQAQELYEQGAIAAIILAPVDTAALDAAGALGMLAPSKPGEIYLTLISGRLRISHVTDHIDLRDVCDLLTPELIEQSLVDFDNALKEWGIPDARIGVAGLNPHAKGREDDEAIAPGVSAACERGIDATGPIAPDTVFRHCLEDKYDAVLAMYHDQGHIAVKTSNFEGKLCCSGWAASFIDSCRSWGSLRYRGQGYCRL